MVAIGYIAQDHQVRLVVAVRVDLNRTVVAAGDVRPDRFAQVADLWEEGCVNNMMMDGVVDVGVGGVCWGRGGSGG